MSGHLSLVAMGRKEKKHTPSRNTPESQRKSRCSEKNTTPARQQQVRRLIRQDPPLLFCTAFWDGSLLPNGAGGDLLCLLLLVGGAAYYFTTHKKQTSKVNVPRSTLFNPFNAVNTTSTGCWQLVAVVAQ